MISLKNVSKNTHRFHIVRTKSVEGKLVKFNEVFRVAPGASFDVKDDELALIAKKLKKDFPLSWVAEDSTKKVEEADIKAPEVEVKADAKVSRKGA